MENAVSFKNVTYTLEGPDGQQTILKNIIGSVPKGEIATIIGPSGSGKSTLLSMCNLFLTPSSGQVFVLEREIRDWPIAKLRKCAGMVLQTPTMLRGKVLDNIMIGANINGFTIDSPVRYLSMVGLSEDVLQKPASELSGGQKQRVALARTLVNQPDILLLDEVTSALDPTSTKEIEDLIKQINQELGTTVLWVTHNLEQAQRVGTCTWLLVDGQLVEASATQTFFESPKHDLTRQFISGNL